MQAYNDFSIVAERYPNSRYAADARQRMAELRDMFARHELDTALYYLRPLSGVNAKMNTKLIALLLVAVFATSGCARIGGLRAELSRQICAR